MPGATSIGHRLAQLSPVDGTSAADGLLEGVSDGRVEPHHGRVDLPGGYPQVLRPDSVETLRSVEHGGVAPVAHVVADWAHRLERVRHIDSGPGQQPPDLGGGRRTGTQIDPS